MATEISQHFNRAGDYYLLDDTDLRGGFRIVTSTDARDAIPLQARKSGMIVRVVTSSGTTDYELPQGKPLTNASWAEASLGGGGGDYIPTAGGPLTGLIVPDEAGGINFANNVTLKMSDGNAVFQYTADDVVDTTPNDTSDDPEPVGMLVFQDADGNHTIEMNTKTGEIVALLDVGIISDASMKTNVQEIKGALARIRDLCGCTYDVMGQRNAGVIAQEVQSVLPEACTRVLGRPGVRYSALIGLLVQSIKELDMKIERLLDNPEQV